MTGDLHLPAIREPFADQLHFLRTLGWRRNVTLRANIDETASAAIITEQGGQENHRERSQNGSSFWSQFA